MALVNVEKKSHILLIGLNRPEKMNAMNRVMYHEIAAAYYQLEHDDDLRVGLMYAEGDHFTSGLQLDDWADVFASGQGIEPGEGELDPFHITGDGLSKPVVFAAQGICFTCGGATIRLQREIGWGNAQRYLLTGDEWTAEQAYEWGLIPRTVGSMDAADKRTGMYSQRVLGVRPHRRPAPESRRLQA
jgi:enoyl-CoA hydratase/carnithine racemase